MPWRPCGTTCSGRRRWRSRSGRRRSRPTASRREPPSEPPDAPALALPRLLDTRAPGRARGRARPHRAPRPRLCAPACSLRAHAPARAAAELPAGASPLPRRRRPEQEAATAGAYPRAGKLEREVTLGQATAFDLHFRLRPTLRRIASELLHARRGIDLDANPAAARRALGDEAFELVRGDREPPLDRFGRGIDVGSLSRVVTSLEAL